MELGTDDASNVATAPEMPRNRQPIAVQSASRLVAGVNRDAAYANRKSVFDNQPRRSTNSRRKVSAVALPPPNVRFAPLANSEIIGPRGRDAPRDCGAYTEAMPFHPLKQPVSRQTVRPCISDLVIRRKVWFELNGTFVIGEGGLDLLDAVSSTGSLTLAAHRVGWSYRHAWGYLRRAEAALGDRLTTTRPGKGGARGIDLTETAQRVMEVAGREGWRRAR